MANIFLLSPENDFSIKHLKVTAKFDNENKGKLRLSVRVLLENKKLFHEKIKMILLIKNDNRKISIETLEEKYNERFYDVIFRNVSGSADRFVLLEEKEEYVKFKVTESFKENENIIDREVFYSKFITCKECNSSELPRDLRQNISRKDLLIEISPHITTVDPNNLILFQFAFIINNYVNNIIQSRWKSSGKIWSVNFDFHEKIGYKSFYENCKDFFSYPEVFELWVYIPKGHSFTASSPLYDKAFNLDKAETQYKVTGEEFKTDENDISVKIMNKTGKPEKFSIICISPNIGEEKLNEIQDKMNFFFNEIKRIPTWRDFIQNMMLTVALFSLLIGVVVIFAQQAIQGTTAQQSTSLPYQDMKGYFSTNFTSIFEICVFVGFSVWGIFSTLNIISKKVEQIEVIGYLGLIIIGILGICLHIFGVDKFFSFSSLIICGLFIIIGTITTVIKIKKIK